MITSRLSNFRSETALEITKQGKATANELALKIAFMTDEEAYRFFKAYYPSKFKVALKAASKY